MAWVIAVWGAVFTEFLHSWVSVNRERALSEPLHLGHALLSALSQGLVVDSVSFETAHYVDIGTPEDLEEVLHAVRGGLVAEVAIGFQRLQVAVLEGATDDGRHREQLRQLVGEAIDSLLDRLPQIDGELARRDGAAAREPGPSHETIGGDSMARIPPTTRTGPSILCGS